MTENEPIVSKYGVYDLFTGEQLLDDEYDAVGYAAGCVFVHESTGTWTVYEAELAQD